MACSEAQRAYARKWYAENKARIRDKRNSQSRDWASRNPDLSKATKARYRDKNREALRSKGRERFLRSYRANPEVWRARARSWQRRNPAYFNAANAKRNAQKLQATPKWLTPEQIREMEITYQQAAFLSRMTGIKAHVDHIEPLQGKDRCGLHVPWNLRVLAAVDNLKKGNRPVDAAALELA